MKEHIIKDVEDLHDILKKYRKQAGFGFRGQANIEWKLIPKAGREQFSDVNDDFLFKHWKRRAKAYLDKEMYTDWDLLSIAQHNGLPTRLLDWTYNPLIAAFFASIELPEEDGALYAYASKTVLDTEKKKPFELPDNNISYFHPASTSTRIINQIGHFTIHNSSNYALNDKSSKGVLERIVIKKEIKKDMVFMLHHYGINYLNIYPDLDGLSKHLTWFGENYKYWSTAFEI